MRRDIFLHLHSISLPYEIKIELNTSVKNWQRLWLRSITLNIFQYQISSRCIQKQKLKQIINGVRAYRYISSP